MPTAAATSESITVAESRPPGLREVSEEESFVPPRTPRWMLTVASGTLILSGTTMAIMVKYSNKCFLPPGPEREPRYFEAPLFQAYASYLGQVLCFFGYCIERWAQRYRHGRDGNKAPSSDKSANKPKCPLHWWLLPTSLDMASSMLFCYAGVFLQLSTVQMLKNLNIIILAILSVVFLGKVINCWQWLGVGILSVGLTVVGLYAFFNPDYDNNHGSKSIIGIVMTVFGAVASACQFVVEEALLQQYYCPPLLGVGIMGVIGSILGLLPLIAGQCVGFEKSSETMYMMFAIPPKENQQLALANVACIVARALFTGSGLMVTKLGSGLLRTILIAARTCCVWVVELLLKWNVFTALNFVGLIVPLTGFVVYNWGSRMQDRGHGKSKATALCCQLPICWGGGTSKREGQKEDEDENPAVERNAEETDGKR